MLSLDSFPRLSVRLPAPLISQQEKQTAASSTLEQLKLGIDSLFTKIKCDKTDISQQLGNAAISDANIMQYMGLIEQRANELLQIQTLLDIQVRCCTVPHCFHISPVKLSSSCAADRARLPVSSLAGHAKVGAARV